MLRATIKTVPEAWERDGQDPPLLFFFFQKALWVDFLHYLNFFTDSNWAQKLSSWNTVNKIGLILFSSLVESCGSWRFVTIFQPRKFKYVLQLWIFIVGVTIELKLKLWAKEKIAVSTYSIFNNTLVARHCARLLKENKNKYLLSKSSQYSAIRHKFHVRQNEISVYKGAGAQEKRHMVESGDFSKVVGVFLCVCVYLVLKDFRKYED